MPSSFISSSSSTPSSPSSLFSNRPHSLRLMDHSNIEQLHFDVPLISTKRPSNSKKSDRYEDYSTETSRRVPFLWERSPGVPKDSSVVRRDQHNNSSSEEFFTPRLPPCRLHLPNMNRHREYDKVDDYNTDDSPTTNMFSDALDKLSLSDSLRLNVPKDMGPKITRAPSFIMDRFLPAANALAASSTTSSPKYPNRRASSGLRDLTKIRTKCLNTGGQNITKFQAGYDYGSYVDHNYVPPASPSRACGIMLLFPWGMRGATCGLKSPVRSQMSTPKTTTSIEEFTRRSRKGGIDWGLSSDDGVSIKAWKSPGWGLPFLDTISRPKGKGKGKEIRESSPMRRWRGGVVSEGGKPLPKLKSPSEPWLAHALSSVNKRRRH